MPGLGIEEGESVEENGATSGTGADPLALCVREDDEEEDELEEAAGSRSGVAAAADVDISAAAAGLFQRRYMLCIAGFFATRGSGNGDGGSGATYPIDITSPRWLAWIPGIVIVFACGCTRTGDGDGVDGVDGVDGGCKSVPARIAGEGDPRFGVPLLLLLSAVVGRGRRDVNPF